MRDESTPSSGWWLLYGITGGLLAVLVSLLAAAVFVDWQTLRTQFHHLDVYLLLGGAFFTGFVAALRVRWMIDVLKGQGETMAR